MARSGCSGLLDNMSLDFGGSGGALGAFGGEGGHAESPGHNSDDASMETVPFSAEQLDAASALPAAPCTMPHSLRASERPIDGPKQVWRAEPSDMACDADRYVQVITSGEAPFQIVWASEAWLQLCEYAMGQVLGHTLEIIQGPLTTRTSVTQLMGAIRTGEPISLSMVNHTRTGKAFLHTLRVEPLRDSRGHVQCFQATSSNIEFLAATLQASMQLGGCATSNPTAPAARLPAAGTARSNNPPSTAPLHPEFAPLAAPNDSPLPPVDGSPEIKPMKRIGSDLKISEMLDLFGSEMRGGGPSPPTLGCIADADQGESEWQ